MKTLFKQVFLIYYNGCFLPTFQQYLQYAPVPLQDIINGANYRAGITVKPVVVMITTTARSIAKFFINTPCNGPFAGQTVSNSHC
jgi:hypothetical protein